MIRPAYFLAPALCALGSCIIAIGNDGMDHGLSWSDRHERQRGSGNRIKELRTVADFTRLRVEGSANVHVMVGGERRVELEFDDNLLPRVRSKVEDGELVLGLERGNYDFARPLSIEISVAKLEDCVLAGSGKLRIENLAGPSFKARIDGSGDVQASGKVDRFEGGIAGSGELACFDLVAREATISISGSGDAHVNASERLQAAIAGSGDVRYRGAPKEVTRSIAGSGSVRAE
jgi:hypothetical protein